MTYLAVFGIPVGVAVVGWLLIREMDRWLDQARAYRDPFAETRDQIRALPEVPDAPFDWEMEEAA